MAISPILPIMLFKSLCWGRGVPLDHIKREGKRKVAEKEKTTLMD
jgi:hypothetical protein